MPSPPDAATKCECGAPADDISFDRSICACGRMHYYCRQCGAQADGCDDAPEPAAAPLRGMDYPEAWAFVEATEPDDHHEQCSWRTTNGALLCDCDVIWDEYVRRGGSDPRVRT